MSTLIDNAKISEPVAGTATATSKLPPPHSVNSENSVIPSKSNHPLPKIPLIPSKIQPPTKILSAADRLGFARLPPLDLSVQ